MPEKRIAEIDAIVASWSNETKEFMRSRLNQYKPRGGVVKGLSGLFRWFTISPRKRDLAILKNPEILTDWQKRFEVSGQTVPRKAWNHILEKELSEAERYLTGRIDGRWDLLSLMRVSPLRQVDAQQGRALFLCRDKRMAAVVADGYGVGVGGTGTDGECLAGSPVAQVPDEDIAGVEGANEQVVAIELGIEQRVVGDSLQEPGPRRCHLVDVTAAHEEGAGGVDGNRAVPVGVVGGAEGLDRGPARSACR